MTTFNFAQTWNQSLLLHDQREIVQRPYIYASELGNAPINIIYAMRGTKPSNPPNQRSLRKFMAGNFFEDLVRIILIRSGVLLSHQERIKHNYDGMLPVSGRIDFIVGGVPDFEKAQADIEAAKETLGHFTYNASMEIIKTLKDSNTKEIDKMILETKSCSSMMFSRYSLIGASDQHKMQCFHYMKGLGLPGTVVYISKDDMLLLECPVSLKTEDMYKGYIKMITDIYNSGELPEKEKEIIFDPITLRFNKNWKVEYSNFLTMIYGYDNPESYRMTWDKIITSANRTYKRCVNGDKMTAKNLEAIIEIKKYFPNYDEMVDMGKEHKDLLVEETEEV